MNDSGMSSEASRRIFLARLASGVAGLGVLAACSGAGNTIVPVSHEPGGGAFADTPQMQAFLHANGLLAIRENGMAIIRNDVKKNADFVRRARRPMILSCQGTPGCIQNTNPEDTFATEFDDVPIGATSSAFVGSEQWNLAVFYNNIDFWTEVLFAVSIPGIGPVYGPVYTRDQHPSCTDQLNTKARAALYQLAQWAAQVGLTALTAKWGQKIATGLYNAGKGLISGTMTLEEFGEAILALCTAEVLADILIAAGVAAMGISVGALIDWLWCKITGSIP